MTSPTEEIYWHVGRVAIEVLDAEASFEDEVKVRMQPLTWLPNFDGFETRSDGGDWESVAQPPIVWNLRLGQNVMEIRALSALGSIGQKVRIVIDLRRLDRKDDDVLPE